MSEVASQSSSGAVRQQGGSRFAFVAGLVGIACVAIVALMTVADVSPTQVWQPVEAYSSRIQAVLLLAALVLPSLALIAGGVLVLRGEKRRHEVGLARIAFWLGAAGLFALVVTLLATALWMSSGSWGGL